MRGFASILMLMVLLISSDHTQACLVENYRTLTGLTRYPKISKVDGTQIFTPHEYINGMMNNPRWRTFAKQIIQVRDQYAPRLSQRRTEYLKNKDPSKPWIKAPGFGYERMKRDADKMAGKSVQEAFNKFNPGARYQLHSDGAKIIITPQNKIKGQEYIEVLYDVSGNYFRLQKGVFTGSKRLRFVSEDLRYIDWSGGVINTEKVKKKEFHELMEKSHWNALIE